MNEGLDLAARYSFMANKLKYQNEDDSDTVLFNHACGKKDYEKVKQILEVSQFDSFLDMIAKKNNLDKYDQKVVEAYWLGNDLLHNLSGEDVREAILIDFTKKGLDKEVAQMLVKSVPESLFFNHNFHLLHLNHSFGDSLRHLRLDKCLVYPAKIKKIDDKKLKVEYSSISKKNGQFHFSKTNSEVEYNPLILDNLSVGDHVSIHWDLAIDKLSKEQVNCLHDFNEKNIDSMNNL